MLNTSIFVGACGWGDQDALYAKGVRSRDKLTIYASHFPIVEVDSSFYAILPQKNYETWSKETPDVFRFIVKPHLALTGHQRGNELTVNKRELIAQFQESIQPLVDTGKLKVLLFQFPPWFDCKQEHVQYIRQIRHAFQDYPMAIEFRHRSWFEPHFYDKTLTFLRDHGVTHVVCDEPQVGNGCVPIVISVTQPKLALVRFHGRNYAGWRNPGGEQKWRDVRYLYNYSEQELREWEPRIRTLRKSAEEVCILFNNNSGRDAAVNAKLFMKILGIEPDGLHPQQLELF